MIDYSNLIVLHEAVHRLVHLKDIEKSKSLLNALQLNKKQKEKVNELRKQCKNDHNLNLEINLLH